MVSLHHILVRVESRGLVSCSYNHFKIFSFQRFVSPKKRALLLPNFRGQLIIISSCNMQYQFFCVCVCVCVCQTARSKRQINEQAMHRRSRENSEDTRGEWSAECYSCVSRVRVYFAHFFSLVPNQETTSSLTLC